MERSLVLVKPDAVERGFSGAIIGRIEEAGMKLIALKMLKLSRENAEQHYSVHSEKPFFPGLINYITSGPIMAAVFEGEDAINTIRKVMGATNPEKADTGTIRKDFGTDIERNAVHGSDGPETAAQEIKLYFSGIELQNYARK
ncbi:MAG: nucleoside-diphosphate kinase [Dehalococcoidia bacterium]|nr:nucleoside-diphosphate kinase [Dehalococcoidia bacterium]